MRLDKDLSALRLSFLLLPHSETLGSLFLWGFSQLSQTGKITTSHGGKTSTLGKGRWGEGRSGRQLGELLNFICVITVLCNTHSAIRYMSAFFLSSYLDNLQWHLIELELPACSGVCGGPLSAQHAALSNHMKTHSDEQCNDWQRAPGRRPHWQITLSTSLSMFLSAHPRHSNAWLFFPRRYIFLTFFF